ncbi:MAG: NAD-dependent epimerase/dehydratase family protein [Nitrospirae bacterium]|nr:MAG: NAD-dependent epimerase/dehydratase family protein [Nitrospirota bacterium]
MQKIFITGGSGFIGKLIVARLIDDPQYETIYLLLRPSHRRSVAERRDELLRTIVPPELVPLAAGKIKAVSGDFVLPELGLSADDRSELVHSVDQILHLGAITDFGSPIETARKINVGGTEKVLALATACSKEGRLKRFDYVSTAYVAGMHKREATEQDLDRGQTFANPYEQSKFEAELLVREYGTRLPAAVYRPSIVIGDSCTGYVSSFSMLYWPLKILADGIPRYFIPGSGGARVDIVPSDFVADAIVALMQDDESLGKTFHLTAGRGNEVQMRTIIGDACTTLNLKKLPFLPIWLANYLLQTPLRHMVPRKYFGIMKLGMPYTSYFEGKSAPFNSEHSAAMLARFGISAPPWGAYKEQIFRYCRESSWGKARILPEYEYYRAAILKSRRLKEKCP